ncbi:DUF4832 domain-containing protein [Cohnella caldifontis]|uniref:DUF4832 domain-containing protein n=1 Tax=Cohnella caldifontis TaxID=3027471 RepID=UPI0023ED043C|nr:DUF4832 domain-containing protein [Cohnella sp. YIM B05605]
MRHTRKFLTAAFAALTIGGCFAALHVQGQVPPASVTYVPAESDRLLDNPYIGFVADARYPQISQPVRLAFAKMTWREIEPRKGEFDFAGFEKVIHLEEWKTKNVKIILRVVLDYPEDEDHLDIPDWLYEEIQHKGTHYTLEYGKGFSPDYSNPVLIREHESLIRALAERYNDDPSIAFVELGSVGHWGEWHTWDEEPGLIPFPKRAVADQYVQAYIRHFSHKPLLMRRPMNVAAKNGMGLFNDAFGKTDSTVDGFWQWYTQGYESWLTGEQEPAMPQFWVSRPSGGEFSGAPTYFSSDKIDETIRQAKLTHVSWMGPDAPVEEPPGGPLQANIDRFLKTIGYRFAVASDTHPESARAGETIPIGLSVVNRGTAPFYFPWKMELSLSDAEGRIAAATAAQADIRQWLPGRTDFEEQWALPETLAPGTYRLNIAILDPETGLPGIEFAMDGGRSDGRYPLGSIRIDE